MLIKLIDITSNQFKSKIKDKKIWKKYNPYLKIQKISKIIKIIVAITISICYLLEKKEIVILSKYISVISVINKNFLFINAKY